MSLPLQARIAEWAIRKMLTKSCPASIPRSGEAAKKVDCVVVYVRRDGLPDLLLDSLSGSTVTCRVWDGTSFSAVTTVDLPDLVSRDLDITHFYGAQDIAFPSALAYAIHQVTRHVYLRLWLSRKVRTVAQFLFNRRSLRSQNRLQVLEIMVLARMTGPSEGLSSWDIMSRLHSPKWMYHPGKDQTLKRLEYLLDALEDSGDIKKKEYRFAATSRALDTLERAEEGDRRHSEVLRLQIVIIVLTLIIALTAIIQAQIIKVPPLLDLTRQ